jgi:hypothetical protein
LINEIEYTGKHFPMAGCAFLLDTGRDTLAVTAKHVLKYFRSEQMNGVSFENTLRRWRMYPKDSRDDVVVVGRLLNENADESIDRIPSGKDWLLFTIKSMPTNVQPLKLRETALEPGETIFVVGWRYPDEGAQRVYEGKYLRFEDGSVLVSVEELADNTVPGLSGSPVIDAHGTVIGVMSSKAGRMQRAAALDYPKALLEKRLLRPVEERPGTSESSASAEVPLAECPSKASECARRMTEHFGLRGWVGITPDIDPENGVITISKVFTESPAARAGFREGDVVRGFNGFDYNDGNAEAFERAYDSFRPGATVIFNVVRDGEPVDIEVHLEPIPDAILEDWIRQHAVEFHHAGGG